MPDNTIKIAHEWRAEFGYEGRGGVVIVYDGETTGWMNSLRDPEGFCPGAIAIDQHDKQWRATGGDDYNGATEWVAL